MLKRRLQIKLFAVFVTAFVCLNASGVSCLAYCQTFDIAPEKDHCPLQKLSNDCDKSGEIASASIGADSHDIDCCPMAVTFFAAPVEAKSFSFETALASELPKYSPHEPAIGVADTFTASFDYRGPPTLDRRIFRVKHRIFRV